QIVRARKTGSENLSSPFALLRADDETKGQTTTVGWACGLMFPARLAGGGIHNFHAERVPHASLRGAEMRQDDCHFSITVQIDHDRPTEAVLGPPGRQRSSPPLLTGCKGTIDI